MPRTEPPEVDAALRRNCAGTAQATRHVLPTVFPLQPVLIPGAIVGMGKLLGLSFSLVLICVAGVFLVHQTIFAFDHDLASLSAWPESGKIAAELARSSNASAPSPAAPLDTRGRYIVDRHGSRFKLISLNWYGASDELFVPGGLDVKNRHDIARTIRRLGFNSVRLPYSDEMVRKNPPIEPGLLAANADLVGHTALQVYGAVVESLTESGVAVIINNHITQARWCCDANPCDGRWANDFLGPLCRVRQTEEEWIENWETVMHPHVHNRLVIGADLRNEVRSLWGTLPWKTWARVAENAAARLHHMQPDWLIIVEGLSSANDISGARTRPIELTVPNKLVYSVHVYGWSGWGSLDPFWRREYNSFAREMQRNWAYLLEQDIAPVWVGELGAPDKPNRGDLNYWKNLMQFLDETDADFGYWAINPRKPSENEVETYSLIEDDWTTIKYDYRLHDLMKLRPQTNSTEAAPKQQLIQQ